MDKDFMGWIDFSFLLSYAVGIVISGFLGDRLNIRYFYSFGLFGTSVCYTLIGLMGLYDI